VHRHVVLGIYYAGRYGTIGMSRREELMYKPMIYYLFALQVPTVELIGRKLDKPSETGESLYFPKALDDCIYTYYS